MLDELEKQIIRELQSGLPLIAEPYRLIAAKLDISEKELLDRIKIMIENGTIRRFGAALKHQDIGFKANAMVVWDVPDDLTEQVGNKMSLFSEVTHCYQRPRRPGWPYNLFTVIHGQSRQGCEKVAKKLSQKTGINKYELIFSTRELKKSSMSYFIDK